MKRKVSAFLWVFALLCSSCTQLVYIKPDRDLKKITIEDQTYEPISKEGIAIRVPTGFGPLHLKATETNGKTVDFSLPRTKANIPILSTSLGLTAVTLPAMIGVGALLANPLWIFLPKIGAGSEYAFAMQTMSQATLPMCFLFALLGSLPLLLLLRGEKLPDINPIYLGSGHGG